MVVFGAGAEPFIPGNVARTPETGEDELITFSNIKIWRTLRSLF